MYYYIVFATLLATCKLLTYNQGWKTGPKKT